MRRVTPLLAVLAVLLAACGPEPATSSAADPASAATAQTAAGPATSAAEELLIVATIYPLAWMAEQIAPEAEVRGLTSQATDPHDLELTPDDRAAIAQADVIAYVGDLDFQPQVEQAIAASSATAVALASATDDLLALEDHAHEADDGHADGDSDEGHAHDREDSHREADPHLWLSPAIMADYALLLADGLAGADPDRADAYRAGAETVAEELRALDAEIDEILSGCELDTAIVSHEAYAYLLEPRGLHQEGISGAAGHGGASPQRLAELVEEIREHGHTAVLTEPVEGREDAEALAAEAGVELLEINPLGSTLTPEEQQRGYPALVREQAEAFAQAMRCDRTS